MPFTQIPTIPFAADLALDVELASASGVNGRRLNRENLIQPDINNKHDWRNLNTKNRTN